MFRYTTREEVDGLTTAKTLEQLRDRWNSELSDATIRVALADGLDERSVAAAATLANMKGLTPVLVIPDGELGGHEFPDGVELSPTGDDLLSHAAMLVRYGEARAMVGGATRTTADVIRACVRHVGRAPNTKTISSSFLMDIPGSGVVSFADCAVVAEPSETQLADIAVATAATHEQLTGEAARVAMLSFSTKGSSPHGAASKIRDAAELARKLDPDLVIDGEFQFDAAFVPEIGMAKAPGSPIQGDANVFIYPDLNSANIAYKIVERVGGGAALGPLIQGLSSPVHDLSRGCSTSDIVDVATIAAYQAINS